jgi:hypothetical protein
MINKIVIPKDCEIFDYDGNAFATTQGTFTSPGYVSFSDLIMPGFTLTCRIKKIKVFVFDNPNIRYNLIYVHNFLSNVGIDILCSKKTCT